MQGKVQNDDDAEWSKFNYVEILLYNWVENQQRACCYGCTKATGSYGLALRM